MINFIHKYILKYIPIYLSVLIIVLCPFSVSASVSDNHFIYIDTTAQILIYNGNMLVNQYSAVLELDDFVSGTSDPYYTLYGTTWQRSDSSTSSRIEIPPRANVVVMIRWNVQQKVQGTTEQYNTVSYQIGNLNGSLIPVYSEGGIRNGYVRRNLDTGITKSYIITPALQGSTYVYDVSVPQGTLEAATVDYVTELNLYNDSSLVINQIRFRITNIEAYGYSDPVLDKPSFPAYDSSEIDSITSSEGEAVQGALDDFNSVKDDVFDTSDLNDSNQYFKGFVAVSRFIDHVTTIPFIRRIFKYSVLIGCAGFILGLVNLIISKDWSPHQRGGGHRRGG